MVYVVGMFGLIGGFASGQLLLYFLLRHRSRDDLLHDKTLKWKYGILNWLIAMVGAYSFITMYQFYFE